MHVLMYYLRTESRSFTYQGVDTKTSISDMPDAGLGKCHSLCSSSNYRYFCVNANGAKCTFN